MNNYKAYNEIGQLTAAIPAGTATGGITMSPLPFDVAENEYLILSTPTGSTYKLQLSISLPAGTTFVRYIKSVGGVALEFAEPVPIGTSVFVYTVDAIKQGRRKSQMYINFSSQFAARTDWVTFSNSGISNHSWNTHTGDTGKVINVSLLEDVSTAIQSVGIVVPFDCTLIGVRATTYRVGNYQSAVGLFVGTPAYNDNATIDMTLRAYAEADNSAGPDSNYSQRPVKAEDLTRNFSLSAGDIILPAALGVSSAGGNLRVSYTIVLQYDLL